MSTGSGVESRYFLVFGGKTWEKVEVIAKHLNIIGDD
jgi:hypothetical protein